MTHTARIVASVAVTALAACGGTQIAGTVDAREVARATATATATETAPLPGAAASLADVAASPSPSAFARRLAASFEQDPCLVESILSEQRPRFEGAIEQEFRRLGSIASALCAADVDSVRLAFNAMGELETRHEGAGAVVADGRVLVLDTFSSIEAELESRDELRYPACGGYFGERADYEIVVAEPVPLTLEVADPDAILLVVSANGQEACGSTSASGGTMVNLAGESGSHEVWVGSRTERRAELTLQLASGVSTGERWVWRDGATTSFPVEVNNPGTDAYSMSTSCVGYVMSAPTVEVWVSEGRYDYVSVTTGRDAVLVARGPSGQIYCNDDYVGLEPGLDMWFEPGAWTFWVGAYSQGTSLSGTITFN